LIITKIRLADRAKKSVKQEQEGRKWINEEVKNPKPENSWPRVEIQTSK
jgi:hypothetical protein